MTPSKRNKRTLPCDKYTYDLVSQENYSNDDFRIIDGVLYLDEAITLAERDLDREKVRAIPEEGLDLREYAEMDLHVKLEALFVMMKDLGARIGKIEKKLNGD